MKKIFLGTFAAMALLFASCSNDTDNGVDIPQGKGELNLEMLLDGESASTKAATTVKPKTSWSNVKDVRVFLVSDADGKVKYSSTFDKAIPAPGGGKLDKKWLNLNEGDYHAVVVANATSTSTNYDVVTYARGAASLWDESIVGQLFGSAIATNLYLDAKALPALPAGPAWTTADKGYKTLPEVFASVAKFKIVKDLPTTVTTKLKREVALLRVRMDVTKDFLAPVDFNHAKSFYIIHRAPLGLTFSPKVVANDKKMYGDIMNGGSNKDKIFVVSTGVNTFRKDKPTATHTNGADMTDAKFTLWQEAVVFPNMTLAKARVYKEEDGVSSDQKYFIQFAGWAPAGYVAEDGVAPAGGALVYWQGVINSGIVANSIREANVVVKTRGVIKPPVDPTVTGDLIINVEEPEDWGTITEVEVEL